MGPYFSDIDCSFFLVTVDLWSEDGQHEMNLVLHPSSTERYAPHLSSKTKRRGGSASSTAHRPTPAGHYTPYFTPQPPPVPDNTGYSNELEVLPFRAWATDTAYAYVPNYANQELDFALQAPSSPGTRDNSSWNQSHNFDITPLPNTELEQGSYAPPYHPQTHQPVYTQYPPSIPCSPPPPTLVTPAAVPPLPRHTYTRTLVGPLSANACRLLDEHRKPGIFFLFQDLSVRTEGQFLDEIYFLSYISHPCLRSLSIENASHECGSVSVP